MDFRANDPGAVQYGNFINYYQFNSAEERIALLPDHVWFPKNSDNDLELPYLVLDIGCNAGDVSQLLFNYLTQRTKRKIHILSVDIDPMLIKRAKEANTRSQQIEFQCVDIMKDEDFRMIEKYLKAYDAVKFDVVFCFSITMWIHLNHHDIGLKEFLKRCSLIADLFVVEPQPWKCYRTAVRRMKRSAKECFPNFTELQWRTEVEGEIQNYMESGLERKMVYQTCPTKWKRKICFYR